jgi:hypothetical protein
MAKKLLCRSVWVEFFKSQFLGLWQFGVKISKVLGVRKAKK